MHYFDIVIPVGPNDINVIKDQIVYTKKNIIGYRNIYIITVDTSLKIDDIITISEDIFPFTIKTVEIYHSKLERNGWYLQQLLKLYAGLVIPDILDKYLVIDSDTYFLKPTEFIKDNKCLYNYGTENHYPYFEHMNRMHGNFVKMSNMSGICHHMIFETKYIKELFSIVENNNMKFYDIFLSSVTDYNKSGASEYEIYFNYMLKYNKNMIEIRPLKWANVNNINDNLDKDYDYISYHWYIR